MAEAAPTKASKDNISILHPSLERVKNDHELLPKTILGGSHPLLLDHELAVIIHVQHAET